MCSRWNTPEGELLKVEERRKKYILGIVMYTCGIVQFAVLIVLASDGAWWLGMLGGVIYLPLATLGQNLMVLHRWW